MTNKPVDDAAKDEITYRLTRLLGGLTILTAVAEKLEDPTMHRHVKEARQKVHNLSTYCRRKYGIHLPKPATMDETE